MNVSLYQSASSLSALERWQEAVAQNITSAQVPGYKKRTVEFASLPMGELQAEGKGRSGTAQSAYFPKATYGISFSPGETQPTRRELDIAIQGEGFFEVQMDDGKKGYTRGGSLHLTPQRGLVTGAGQPILKNDGTPVTLLPEGGAIVVNVEGTILQGDTPIGRLSVVKFDSTSRLVPVQGGLFVPQEGTPDPEPVANPAVIQGHLEASNVSPLQEMVALVQIARAYEANQKIISSRDQIVARTLETLT